MLHFRYGGMEYESMMELGIERSEALNGGIDGNNSGKELKMSEVKSHKDEKGQLIWTAYCITCATKVDACANGAIIEGVARYHISKNAGHKVIVGSVWSE